MRWLRSRSMRRRTYSTWKLNFPLKAEYLWSTHSPCYTCLSPKMQEMAVLGGRDFNISRGSMPPDPLAARGYRCSAHSFSMSWIRPWYFHIYVIFWWMRGVEPSPQVPAVSRRSAHSPGERYWSQCKISSVARVMMSRTSCRILRTLVWPQGQVSCGWVHEGSWKDR